MDKYKLRTMEEDEKYLRQTSKDVEKDDPNLEEYVNVLKNYCENNEVFAMASVQLGIPFKIIYLKNAELDNTGSNTNEGVVLINPEIIEERGKTYYWEGCGSRRVLAKVCRPYYVKVRYFNQEFEEKVTEFKDMYATVISHEYDHIFGIIHTDIADEITDYPFSKRKEFRKKNGYMVVSKSCEYNHPLRGKYRLRTIENDEEYLRQVSKDVDPKDPDLEKELDVFSKYCAKEDVFAMAAVQIGIPKKIIYLKNTKLDMYDKTTNKGIVLINPKIVEQKGETTYWEACASCMDNMGKVTRPYFLKLEYLDADFNKKTATFEGESTTIVSHEYDHLFGILHVDIADEILDMPGEERKKYREKDGNGYIIISKAGEYKHPLR